jgi:hypothetical protein
MKETKSIVELERPEPFAVQFEELVTDVPDGPQDSKRMENPDTSTYRRDTDDHDT